MNGFKRRDGVITEHFSTYEVGLLVSLVTQLVELVGAPEVEAEADPFERLASEWDHPSEHDDPALDRLFPTAYSDDESAEADYRRYSEPALRARKAADAQLVLDQLEATDEGAYELRIPQTDVDAWLKTLNALRLVLSVRLGLDDEEAVRDAEALPDDDPRALLVNVYDWLGFALETLLDCL